MDIFLNHTNKVSTRESRDFTSVYFLRIWNTTTIRIAAQEEREGIIGGVEGTVNELKVGGKAEKADIVWRHEKWENTKVNIHSAGTTNIDVIFQDERKEVSHETPKDLRWKIK